MSLQVDDLSLQLSHRGLSWSCCVSKHACCLTGDARCVQVDDFGLQLPPLGPLQELSLSLQEGLLHRGWHCEMVLVEDTAAGVLTYFWCDR